MIRWALALTIFIAAAPRAARATPPCWQSSKSLNIAVPNARHEPIPRNGKFFFAADEDPSEVTLSMDGVALETDVEDHGAHFELSARELFVTGTSVTVARPQFEYSLLVAEGVDDEPPAAPAVSARRAKYECRPIVTVEVVEDEDAVILLSRFDAPPTTDEPADAAIVIGNDTLVLESEDGSDRTVFLVAVDLAGNRSEPTEVLLDFNDPPGCSSGRSAIDPAAWALVGWLFLRRRTKAN